MKISIIGSGNTATILGRLLKQNGYIISEIFSRYKSHAVDLAQQLNAVAVDAISSIQKNSDIYIIAVNDDAIEQVCRELKVDKKMVVHTSGSVSKNVLKKSSENYGVLYPLQSLRKEINYIPVIPFLIDANNDQSHKKIVKLATSISNNVTQANDKERLQYHLSAVIVSNFTNHLYALAKEYCALNHINFSLLFPLIEEIILRLQHFNPTEMQTGPAARKDISTINKHIKLLNNFPQLKSIYKLMSESIIKSKQ